MADPLAVRAEPIPGYRLLEFLGRGGFGEVWKAEAPGGLPKAIKIVYGNLEEAFGPGSGTVAQELKSLSRVKTVRHPFILSLERYDIIDGQLFIVMELADCNLEMRFQQCRAAGLPGIPRAELLRYVEEAAEALDLMNQEHQLQHLDIKPQNLFLIGKHIKVADFGLVKDLEGMAASLTGGVTPVYAAPETFEHTVSRFCDQYSLAIVYQELLTGRRPFNGANARQLLFQHLNVAPDVSPLPPGDQEIIARALSKQPTDRFPSCSALAEALRGQGSTIFEPGRLTPVPEPRLPGTGETSPAALPGSRSTLIVPRPDSERPSSRLFATPAPPVAEQTGDGILTPALVIGLGGFGRAALQRLRDAVCARFGSVEAVPQLRLLALDTEAEIEGDRPPDSAPEKSDSRLAGRDVFFTRLNRPNHYLRARGVATPLVGWLDPGLIARIPRNLATAGVRALGRLAFFDHFRAIAQRLTAELSACSNEPALKKAAQDSGLGLRSNWPRVYVVTSLAGGTGSGMFIDTAYTVRAVLRRLGYGAAPVVGVFHLPPAALGSAPEQELANTVAALTELHHFSAPDSTFSAVYLPEEDPICDPSPPFRSCVFLPQEEADTASRPVGQAAAFLVSEMFTSLGRTAEAWRTPSGAPIPRCEWRTVGSYRLAWPRAALVRRAGRRLCRFLVKAWAEKGGATTAATMRAWVADQWAGRQWEPPDWAARIEAACQEELGRSPETVLAEVTEAAAGALQGSQSEPAAAQVALGRLERLLGRPDGVTIDDLPLEVAAALERAGEKLLTAARASLFDLTLGLIEEPQFRLAGAEEAVRQVTSVLQQKLLQQEEVCGKLDVHTRQLRDRIRSLFKEGTGRVGWLQRLSGGGPATEMAELLRLYARFRYQYLVQRGVVRIYQGLIAECPALLHEVNLCRGALGDLAASLEARAPGPPRADLGPGYTVLPAGADTSREAVSRTLEGLARDDALRFDRAVQAALRERFPSLRTWCRSPAHSVSEMENLLQARAEAFVLERLGDRNALSVWLQRLGSEAAAADELAAAFDEAVPLAAGSRQELALLAVPAGADPEQVRRLATQALPEARTVPLVTADEVLVYRERNGIELGRLPQMNARARTAYERLLAQEHGNPHSRIDIAGWKPI